MRSYEVEFFARRLRHHLKTVTVSLFGVLFLALIGLNSMGCEPEKETVEVEVFDTLMVSVSVIPSPDSVAVGGSVTLTAEVTTELEVGTLRFFWHATDGTFDEDEGDTVIWKAPGEEGAYTVTVHATDGEYIGIGSAAIGVGMYAPTVTPYYVGYAECSTCHGEADISGAGYSIYDAWTETNHSHAWTTLQESGHAASYCFGCHTVGYAAGTGTGDGGYDEAPIAKFENVQCENCHGPGSDHISTLDKANITVTYEASMCGSCHTGPHNPTYDEEWINSPHNFDPATAASGASAGAGFYASCQGCHEGVAASIRLAGDLDEFYGGGTDFYPDASRPDTTERSLSAITCGVCHDPHNATNDHQIRTVEDVYLVTANDESPIVSDGGTGKLCMQCHHARRAAEGQIEEGYAHFGPHANPQADMLAGKSAYHDVAESGFTWAQPSHLYVENSCRTCHVHMIPYGELGDFAVTGHKFEPTVEACQRCHGSISEFTDIMALEDFDGDGDVEGVQDEVEGLLKLLESALVDSFEALGFGIDAQAEDFDLAHYLGDVDSSTVAMREAGYNLVFIEDDKSLGVHNPDYAVQLLQQSYRHLTGDYPANTVVHLGDLRVAARW
ncbi:MAG: ammonia-forming cytochrome c nitrite reductase subunit c552 [Candidatus Neomarinimicrobiota bacterium]